MVKKIISVVAALTTTGALMFAGTAVATPLSDAPSNTGPYTNETIHTQVNTAEGARGSLAILPDTQFYSRYVAEGDMFAARYGENVPDPFASQTKWIADNTDKYNIGMTQHVGDVVDRSNREGEWETASAAIKNLEDAQLPYAIIPGNHDSEGWQTWPAVGVWDSYLTHFPIERQAQSPSFKGAGAPSGAANYHEFNIGGVDMLSVNLADERDFDWANEVLAQYPTTPAIVTMHEILDVQADGTALTSPSGERLWDSVISKHPQVFMTFSGHNHGSTNLVRYINDDPNLPVFQQLLDYQMYFQGGNGLMSLVEFDYTNNQLSLTSFSPWVFDKPQDLLTELDSAMLSDAGATFTISYNFAERFSQFNPDFATPEGNVSSATATLRTYLDENFDEPEQTELVVPTNPDDYIVAENTVAHWRPTTDDNGEIYYKDITGNGNDMAQHGEGGTAELVESSYLYSSYPYSVSFTPESETNGIYFETASDAPANADQFRDGYTVEAFVRMTPGTPNSWMAFLFRTPDEFEENDGSVNFGTSNLNEVRWKSAGWQDVEAWSNWSGEIFKGQWYHLAAVNNVEDDTVQLYINGNPILRDRRGEIHNGINNGNGDSNNAPWRIGGGQDILTFVQKSAWQGEIGEIRLVEGALPRDQWLTARAVELPSEDPSAGPSEEPSAEPSDEPSAEPLPVFEVAEQPERPSRATNKLGEATGDSYADLWSIDAHDNLRFYTGAKGTFHSGKIVATGQDQIADMTPIPDVNGDNRADILVTETNGHAYFYYSLGDGFVQKGIQVGHGWSSFDNLTYAGELGSSNTEYVVARKATTGELYRYDLKDSGLSNGTKIGHGWNAMTDILGVGQFIGSGNDDIIAIRDDGRMFAYEGLNNGTIVSAGHVGHGWGSFTNVSTPGDITGDGRIDLVGISNDGKLFSYANTGRGYFEPAVQAGHGWSTFRVLG